MNAYKIIQRAIEEEMMKHALWYSARKCACGGWLAPEGRAYGTLNLQHARHVAEVVATRLTDLGDLRQAMPTAKPAQAVATQ